MGCGTSKSELKRMDSPLRKLDDSPKLKLTKSITSDRVLDSSKLQRVDSPTLSAFRIKHTDFIKKNEQNIKAAYDILTPPIGRGNHMSILRII
jgi:hypothetical protein